MSYRDVVLAKRPDLYLRFEGSSTPPVDWSGNGRNATSIGSGFVPGQPSPLVGTPDGHSCEMGNGGLGTQGFKVAYGSWMDAATSFSMVFFIRGWHTNGSNTANGICINRDGNVGRVWEIYLHRPDSDGGISLDYPAGGHLIVNSSRIGNVTESTWYLVGCTWNSVSTVGKIYIDGCLNATASGTLGNANEHLWISTDGFTPGSNNASPVDMNLAEFAYWGNREIQPSDMRDLQLARQGMGYGQGIWRPDRRRRGAA